MTNSIKGIKDIVKYNEVIQISNSSTISNIRRIYKDINKIELHNVLHIPSFKRNLLSLDNLMIKDTK
jgi:hypothetical protein